MSSTEQFSAPAHAPTEDQDHRDHDPHDDHDRRDHDQQDQDERPHACYQGVVFIGRLVVGDDGEEVEIVDAVPCRRCTSADS